MVKRRPAVVLSPGLRHREGLCTAIPLSTTPAREVPHQCRIELAEALAFIEQLVCAKADMLATVSFGRARPAWPKAQK
jgi:uncharacterized protein YifN (PemK superfamily)